MSSTITGDLRTASYLYDDVGTRLRLKFLATSRHVLAFAALKYMYIIQL